MAVVDLSRTPGFPAKFVIYLIELWKKEECLWNVDSPAYSVRLEYSWVGSGIVMFGFILKGVSLTVSHVLSSRGESIIATSLIRLKIYLGSIKDPN